MKLREGRIGVQESVSVLALLFAGICIFTIESASIYADGNTSYIFLPAGILLALLFALCALWVMNRKGYANLNELYYASMGPLLGRFALLLLCLTLLYQALELQTVFIQALHSYIYRASRYEAIIAWVMFPVLYIAWGGLERIGRSAKCVALFAAFGLLAMLLLPLKAYAWFRLFPFPDKAVLQIGINTVTSSFRTLPAMLGTLTLCSGMQGKSNVKKSILIAALCALGLVFLTQFCLGLTFTSEQIKEIYMPLFRIDMTKLPGSYYFRQDKVGLFLWLFGLYPAISYLFYNAAILFCKTLGVNDIRPVLLTFFAWVMFAQIWVCDSFFILFQSIKLWVDQYGFVLVAAPLLIASAMGSILKNRRIGA